MLSLTKNISGVPCLVKSLEKRFSQKNANLNIIDHPPLIHLGKHNDVIPNEVLHFRFMPLNILSRHSIQIVQRGMLRRGCQKFLFSRRVCSSETIIVVGPNPTRFTARLSRPKCNPKIYVRPPCLC